MSKVFDIVVIGGGVNGCATAHQFAKNGFSVALVEQFNVPNARNSSAGLSRITRYANSGKDELTPIMEDSFREWLWMEKQTNTQLLLPATLLAFGTKNSDFLEKMRRSSRQSGGSAEFVSIASVNEKYSLSYPKETQCLKDPTAGCLLAENCVKALSDLFKSYGGKLYENWKVSKIIPTAENVNVEGPKGNIIGKKVIVCAGPWTKKLMEPLGLYLPLKTIKVGVYYWKKLKDFDDSFVMVHEPEDKTHYYGTPEHEYPGLVKICYHDGVEIDPDARDSADMQQIKQKMCSYVKNNYPWINPSPAIEESCMYTVTPDESMIIDRHPLHPNVLYACGFSGSGFKIAPTIGKIMVDLANNKKSRFAVDVFSLKRFSRNISKL